MTTCIASWSAIRKWHNYVYIYYIMEHTYILIEVNRDRSVMIDKVSKTIWQNLMSIQMFWPNPGSSLVCKKTLYTWKPTEEDGASHINNIK